VDNFLSPSQSGFHIGISVTRRYVPPIHYVIEILVIDSSSTFDIIRRKKRLDVLHSFLDTDYVQLIRLLLSETTIMLGLITRCAVGSPQGGSLSPILSNILHNVPRSSPSNIAKLGCLVGHIEELWNRFPFHVVSSVANTIYQRRIRAPSAAIQRGCVRTDGIGNWKLDTFHR